MKSRAHDETRKNCLFIQLPRKGGGGRYYSRDGIYSWFCLYNTNYSLVLYKGDQVFMPTKQADLTYPYQGGDYYKFIQVKGTLIGQRQKVQPSEPEMHPS
jgi:hypothetical protein